MYFQKLLNKELEIEREFLKQYQNGAKSVAGYREYRLSQKTSHGYYAVHKASGREKYLSRNKFHIVRCLQKQKLCETGTKILEKNIKAIEGLLKVYKPYDPESLEASLPRAYQTKFDELKQVKEPTSASKTGNRRFTQSENPYHQEHLKHVTSFGLIVRSRIEAAAAELAYSRGYYIMYEKRVVLYDEEGNLHVVYPDFILCENPHSPEATWIYWEHLGLLDLEDYRERTMLKLKLFPQNGILPGRSLILTTDSMNESIDLMAVSNVLDTVPSLQALQ